MSKNFFKFLFLVILCYVVASVFVSGTVGLIFIFVLLCLAPLLLKVFSLSLTSLIICMLFSAFFIPFNYFYFLNILNVFNPITLLGLVLALKLFQRKFILKQNMFSKPDLLDYLYFLFIICAFISTFSAISKLGALNWIFYSYITGFLVYKVISSFGQQDILKVIKTIIIFASICAIYGIIEFLLFRRSLIFPEIRVGSGRLTSLLGHPLFNGIIFASMLPLSIVSFLQTQKKTYLFSSFILFFAVVLTFSRGSWLALLFGIIVLLCLIRLKFKVKLAMIFSVLVLLVGLISPLRGKLQQRILQPEYKTFSSWNIRLKSIPIAFQIVKNYPFFGGGPFNAARYKDRFAAEPELRMTSFENSYLGLLVDLGYIGLGIILLIIISTLVRSFFTLWRRKKHTYYLYLVGVFCSSIIFLLNMATFNFDSHRLFHFFLWLFLSLNVAFIRLLSCTRVISNSENT